MFQRLPDIAGETVTLTVDGRSIRACPDDTVAAVLLAAGVPHCRTAPGFGAARALLHDGRVLGLPGHDRWRRQPARLPGACARRHGHRDAARQAGGGTM